MKRRLRLAFCLSILLGFSLGVKAQMPQGSDAIDFTVTDIDGVTWNLFDLLDDGYVVYLEFSATWCGPCWNYHSAGHLKNLFNNYGPNATGEVFVIYIEADPNTSNECLFGPSGCIGGTQGDWVTGTPFPIVDLTNANVSIRSNYQVSYYPTIYAICPDSRKVYEAKQRNEAGQYEYVTSCAMTADLVGVTDASCFGSSDGAVDISVVEGLSPFTYTWSNNATTQDLEDVPAGTYSCVIKEKNLIEVEVGEYEVGQPDEIIALANQIVDETCPGDSDGSIETDVSGGAGGFSFSWDNGFSSQDIYDLESGTYTLIVTDGDGCTSETSFFVPVNPVPFTDAGDDDVITCIQSLITLDGTGSENMGVSYQWTTQNGNIVSGADTPTPIVDQDGEYVLTVTFLATGCESDDFATVFEYTDIPLTLAGPDKELNCAISQDTLDGSASQQGGGYSLLWTTDNGNIVSGDDTPRPVVDAEGTYVLTIINENNGCVGVDTAVVIFNNNFQEPEGEYAYTKNNLQVNFNSNLTGNPSSILWTFGDGGTSTAEDPTHIYQSEGTYEVCLIVSNLCGADTTCADVSVTAGFMSVSVVAITNATCNNNSTDGGVDIEVAGGMPDFTYAWSNNQTTQDLADVPAGTYSVTVTDSDGESVVLNNIVIGSNHVVDIDQVLVEHVACFGETTGVIAVDVNASGSTLDFTWSHDVELENSVASDLGTGSYSVLVEDENGCTDEVTVNVIQPDLLEGTVATTPANQGQNNGSATVTMVGGTSPYTYAWSSGGNEATESNLAPGQYTVEVTDANGCKWDVEVTIEESTSTTTIEGLTDWTLAPNPARAEVMLTLTFEQSEQVQIRILSILGTTVFERAAEGSVIKQWIPLYNMAPGVYMVEVATDKGRVVQQFIVQ